VLTEQVFVDRPPAGFSAPLDAGYAAHLADLMEARVGELAAVIVEPVVQGAGGMHIYSPDVVGLLRALCDQHDVPLILDEIATGFGRTGALFACEHARVSPDVMCVGKALSGGYLPLGATLCSRRIAEAISMGEGGALMHGPTFMGNALACAVALASTDLLAAGGWRADVARIEAGLADGLRAAGAVPGVKDVRVLGAIGAVQLDRPVDVASATHAAMGLGVWLRPFRDLVYTMPPYVIDEHEIARITAAVVAAAAAGAGGSG
jgi:adenosylmethionine-8-amino-7-oxononanoate aminotransferase